MNRVRKSRMCCTTCVSRLRNRKGPTTVCRTMLLRKRAVNVIGLARLQ
ncbi:Uncharacterised protein [Vibrio cholerae]|nr:Uncharacterised protein [Vibrio cholerae]